MVVSRLRSIWTVPDLRNKILFTLGMLLIFRVVAYIPVPGIDATQISNAINSNTNTGMVAIALHTDTCSYKPNNVAVEDARSTGPPTIPSSPTGRGRSAVR